MENLAFLFSWIAINLIAFVCGSALGATSTGLVPYLIPGYMGLVLGDLLCGAVIGYCQWLVLKRARGFVVSPWWIAVSSVGFLIGARAGALLTYRIAGGWLLPSIVFGVFMGGSIGFTTAWVLRHTVDFRHLPVWVAVSLVAWILGEGIAFSSGFAQAAVPQVALAIAGVTGLGLTWIRASK